MWTDTCFLADAGFGSDSFYKFASTNKGLVFRSSGSC